MDIGRPLPPDVAADLLDELVAYKARFDALLAVSHRGIVHLDAAGTIVRWNPAAESMTGISESRVIGTSFRSIAGDGAGAVLETTGDAPNGVRLDFPSRNGDALRVHADVIAIRNGENLEGWLLSFAPQRRYDEIEQLKTELIGSISHELKTPLATIKAFAETLRSNGVQLTANERSEYLGIIGQQADHLTHAIEKLLLVSRVEAGHLLKQRVISSLDEILDAALAAVPVSAGTHPFVRETTGIRVSGDPELLREAFMHVLDNAVKFSPQGGPVTIRARQADKRCVVDIIDRGIGIAPEHIPYLFDRFYRVETELSAPTDGTGLGLFIANSLVRAHGGTIEVRSEPGAGSTFSIALPERG